VKKEVTEVLSYVTTLRNASIIYVGEFLYIVSG
jgi:hypothetical protein